MSKKMILVSLVFLLQGLTISSSYAQRSVPVPRNPASFSEDGVPKAPTRPLPIRRPGR